MTAETTLHRTALDSVYYTVMAKLDCFTLACVLVQFSKEEDAALLQIIKVSQRLGSFLLLRNWYLIWHSCTHSISPHGQPFAVCLFQMRDKQELCTQSVTVPESAWT